MDTKPSLGVIAELENQRDLLLAEVERLKALSVTNIMVDVQPGPEGMGEEVYARSVEDVEHVLSALSEKADALDLERDRLKAEVRSLTRWKEVVRDGSALLNQRDHLLAVCKNFEIQGPDADGFMWLVLHGNGTTGKGIVNLGKDGMLVVQVAQHLEAGRKAAIASVEGSA